jgi:hypothetical protein
MNSNNDEGRPIDLTQRVEVVYSDKAPAYVVKGSKSKVHPEVAKKLKAKGWIK